MEESQPLKLPTPVTIKTTDGHFFKDIQFVKGPNLGQHVTSSSTELNSQLAQTSNGNVSLPSGGDPDSPPSLSNELPMYLRPQQHLYEKASVPSYVELKLPEEELTRFLPKDPHQFSRCAFSSQQTIVFPEKHGNYWQGMTEVEESLVRNRKFREAKIANRPVPILKTGIGKKYVPAKQSEDQLYDDIEEGPGFDQLILSADIHISGGSEEISFQMHKAFDEYNLAQVLLNNLMRKGYSSPTPVQRAVMTVLTEKMNGDVIVTAPTGSGKTAAYLLPLIHDINILKQQRKEGINRDSPYAIIMFPTRELSNQICENARALAAGTCVVPARCYGSFAIRENREEIQNGCDILCCTMGRLLSFLADRTVKLNRAKYLVLDEADELICQKEDFFKDVTIIKGLMTTHRVLLFSATYNEKALDTVDKIVRPNPYFVSIGVMNQAVESVVHKFVESPHTKKIDTLADLLKSQGEAVKRGDKVVYMVPKTVVFVNRKKSADRVAIALTLKGIKSWSMNSDRPQKLREEALNALQNDEDSCVLVSTDLMSRGHNIKNLKQVINFDLPDDIIRYIHRIGRTGRKGNVGHAISFFNPLSENDTRLAPQFIKMLESINQEPPQWLVELSDYVEKCEAATLDMLKEMDPRPNENQNQPCTTDTSPMSLYEEFNALSN